MKLSPLMLLPPLGLGLGFVLAWWLDRGEPGAGPRSAPAGQVAGAGLGESEGVGGAAGPGADPRAESAASQQGQGDGPEAAARPGPAAGLSGSPVGLATARSSAPGELPERFERGWVVDRESGQAIPAKVRLVLPGEREARRAEAPESGEFEIPWPAGARGDLWVESPGYAPACWPDVERPPHSGLWLDPVGALVLTLRDFGQRGDEVLVELWRLDLSARAAEPCLVERVPVDQEARFEALQRGLYLVSVRGPLAEQPAPGFPPRALRSGVRIESREETRLEVRAPRGVLPRFEIEVPPTRDQSVWVELWPVLQGPAGTLVPGSQILPLAAGQITRRGQVFHGIAESTLPTRFEAIACTSTGQRWAFDPRASPDGSVPLEILPPLAPLGLRLRDSQGRPLANARVLLVPADQAQEAGPWLVPDQDRLAALLPGQRPRGRQVLRSDAAGRALAEVPSGAQLLLAVWPAEYEQVLAGSLGLEAIDAPELRLIDPLEPETLRELEVELERSVPLDVLALDAQGDPARGARIELYLDPVWSGEIRSAEQESSFESLEFMQAAGWTPGLIGEGLDGICRPAAAILPPAVLEIGADGRGFLAAAPPQPLLLVARLPGHLPIRIGLPALADRRRERPQRLRLDFEPEAVIVGQVVDELGAGVERARVRWTDRSQVREVECDSVGRFRFDELEPGYGELRASALGHAGASLDRLTWLAGEAGRARLVVQRTPLPRLGALRLTLRTQGTKTAPLGVRCSGAGPFASLSDEGDEQVLTGIDPAPLALRLSAPWHLPAPLSRERVGFAGELHNEVLMLDPLMRLWFFPPEAAWLEGLELTPLSVEQARSWEPVPWTSQPGGKSQPEGAAAGAADEDSSAQEAESSAEQDGSPIRPFERFPWGDAQLGRLELLGRYGSLFVSRSPYELTLRPLPAPLLLPLQERQPRPVLPPGLELWIQP